MPQPLLKIEKLTKIYGRSNNGVKALDGVDLSIHKGEIFALLGVNGAGKTTLSSLLATVHPPTGGDVLYNGRSIYSDLYSYRKDLGLCPQIANLDPYLNVYENLVFAGRYYLLTDTQAQERADELLTQYDLARYKLFAINQLSGGTRQRVLIARAMMHKPKIVILDEPTVGLDPDVRRTLWDHIKRLKDDDVTVILTTHYLDEAEYLADRVCLLRAGRVQLIQELGTLKAENEGDSLEQIFIRLSREFRKENE